jgi:hypothetical protein
MRCITFDGDYDNDARNNSNSIEQASLYDPLYIINNEYGIATIKRNC